MDEWQAGWKVARLVRHGNRQRYWSAVAYSSACYERGRLTKPPPNCGPLAVFSERRDAERFRRSMHPSALECLPCAYLPAKVQDGTAPFWSPIEKFLSRVPDGTRLARAVVLW